MSVTLHPAFFGLPRLDDRRDHGFHFVVAPAHVESLMFVPAGSDRSIGKPAPGAFSVAVINVQAMDLKTHAPVAGKVLTGSAVPNPGGVGFTFSSPATDANGNATILVTVHDTVPVGHYQIAISGVGPHSMLVGFDVTA